MADSSARLTILRGPPGSGKTTEAQRMVDAGEADRTVENDTYFTTPGGEYRFDPRQLGAAHAWCQRTAREFLEDGLRVVVSNTAIKRWEFQPYLDMACKIGCADSVRNFA